MSRSRLPQIVLGIALVALAVIQYAHASSDFVDASQRSLFNLRLGDCFDAPTGTDVIAGVQTTGCDSAHQFEVFGFGTIGDRQQFDEATIAGEASELCIPQFERYVGKPAAESELSIMHLSPTLASWGSADRTVTCLLFHPLRPLQSSMIRAGI